jgi:sec-independent protein translocase protein TatB
MFDIGLSEFAIIGVVALVVLGPEKLPKVARMAGQTLSKLQRYVAQVKSDINREFDSAELSKVKREVEQAAQTFKTELESNVNSVNLAVNSELRKTEDELQKQIGTDTAEHTISSNATDSTSTNTAPSLDDDWAKLSQYADEQTGYKDVTHTIDSHRPINEDR